MISPMPLIPELLKSRRKIAERAIAGSVSLWQKGRLLERKLSRQESLSFGPMTQQPAIRMRI